MVRVRVRLHNGNMFGVAIPSKPPFPGHSPFKRGLVLMWN